MALNFIDNEQFVSFLKEELNEQMKEAAEPFIQQALKEIEIEMRKQLSKNLISIIQHDLELQRMGHDLRILIKQALPEGK